MQQIKAYFRVVANRASQLGRHFGAALLFGTIAPLAISPAHAQTTTSPPQSGGTIRSINVSGSQRLEPDTVRSYIQLRPGTPYTVETLDQAIRTLFDTELFADVQIRDNNGDLTIEVRENPVINRVLLEGNKRLKEDKINKEIKIAPRQIFTRSKIRADVARIVELYRRQGRFAANVEPKMVMLDQNRVDVVFEISEGPKSKVRQINILGNEKFSDGELRGEMATKQSRFYRLLSSGDSYDPDKLAFDQSKLRQFYLTQGYADFRIVSAVAELTPDKRDFIITYVVEEGERYKFGEVKVESDIRDFKPEAGRIAIKSGDFYNAKLVEDTVDSITQSAGLFGYAFAEVNPSFDRDKDARTMSITFKVDDAPRVYVEQININGNTLTQDKVIRREFRLTEGDAFNSFQVKRSSDRIQSLGFFQEKLEIEQKPGSAPDRVILEANVEERSTGELQLSAGFSSLERFIINTSIRQRNFRGKGQELRASLNLSSFSKSIELGFTEPYLFDKNIALGGDIFRRDFDNFNRFGGRRNTTFQQITTGFQLRVGVPITEFLSVAGRYGINYDEVTIDRDQFFIGDQCSPLLAGRFLCDAIGNRTTSSLGYSLVFDNLNNRLRPSRGQRLVFSQDFAGLGGSVKYLRSRLDGAKYWQPFGKFVFSVSGEAGYIQPYGKGRGPGNDKVRLTDRFYLGQPEFRGFDIRGIGPRVQRFLLDQNGNVIDDRASLLADDAIGGRAFYRGRLELEVPVGSGAKGLGLRPSLFLDFGSVFNVKRPTPLRRVNGSLLCVNNVSADVTEVQRPMFNAGGDCPTGTTLFRELGAFEDVFRGNTAKPRVAAGIGVNLNSPFGPFRIDISRALLKERGDDVKNFSFNVGTAF
jgi:outer membrane protein insertion porin family